PIRNQLLVLNSDCSFTKYGIVRTFAHNIPVSRTTVAIENHREVIVWYIQRIVNNNIYWTGGTQINRVIHFGVSYQVFKRFCCKLEVNTTVSFSIQTHQLWSITVL